MKTVLKNLSYIATFDTDDTEMQDADIVIDGRRIDRIGSDLPTRDADRVIDGRGLLATPGLINAHQHLYQASLRTIPQLERSGMPAFLMAQNTIGLDRWRAGRLGAAEQRVIARAALTESVLGGITTVADQHLFFPGREPEPYVEETIAAAGEVGVRLHACRGTITFSRAQGGMVSDEQAEPIEEIVAHCRELIARYHDPEPFAMVRVALAPSGVISDTPALFDALAELAEEHATVRLHTHLHHFEDTRLAHRLFGTSPWRILQKHGFANDKLWVAHCPTAPVEEISEYVTAGIAIAHIPAADLKLGWGLAPIRAWLDAGIPVGVGTTGSMTNDGANLLGDLRVAALAHRAVEKNPERWPSARELLAMATRGSAACLGRDDLGVLAPGMAADIACWDLTGVDRIGIHDPVAALLFTGLSQVARLVLVNGQIVVEGGVPTKVDPAEGARLSGVVFGGNRRHHLRRGVGTSPSSYRTLYQGL
jgi:8-oxoguanine deaminase